MYASYFSVGDNHRYSGIGSPLFFVKKKFPVFFFLFGIFVIKLCYIIREISADFTTSVDRASNGTSRE
jgi:hypothetical protein